MTPYRALAPRHGDPENDHRPTSTAAAVGGWIRAIIALMILIALLVGAAVALGVSAGGSPHEDGGIDCSVRTTFDC